MTLAVEELSVGELLDALAEPGAAAAGLLTGVLLAACAMLVEMVARAGTGEPLERARALRDRALLTGQADDAVYDAARELLAARGGQLEERDEAVRDVERELRDERLGVALHRAAEAPLALALVAGEVAALAEEVARESDPSLRADAVVAAHLAAGAAAGARTLVATNLLTRGDDPRLQRAEDAAVSAAASARAAAAL